MQVLLPRKALARRLGLHVLAIMAVMVALETTGLDLVIQDQFANSRATAAGSGVGGLVHAAFYTGPKAAIIGLGIVSLAFGSVGFLSPALWPFRRRALAIALALGLIPAVIGGLKAVTNVHCPYQIDRYGGSHPYDGLFALARQRSNGPIIGRCFPAGHASGGFALMALAWALPPRRAWIGRAAGLVVGWAMGLYQMAQGAHFLSHTIVTMVIALMIVEALGAAIGAERRGFPNKTMLRSGFGGSAGRMAAAGSAARAD